jgi:hypothetical protein
VVVAVERVEAVAAAIVSPLRYPKRANGPTQSGHSLLRAVRSPSYGTLASKVDAGNDAPL